ELQDFEHAKTIAIYLHIGSEVRTREILARCTSQGKRVIIPVTNKMNRRLIFSELKAPEKELIVGNFGILEPKTEFLRPVLLDEAEIVLVPGIAWDLCCHRIGYGGGYYDRSINSLHNNVLTVGLGYEFQIVREIPTTRYDRSVDRIVTERRVITKRLVHSVS
ncbi:MAG TPA: 5-formyltetrahydrofolate cyclo-ligase, partial [Terriglobales bacterium]|nr:5-formyltetrahydrofolate cyclo-ligase [Terriglobales bacterium]